MSHTIWILDQVSERAKRLSLDVGVPVEIAQILINRGIDRADKAHRFLHGTLSDLYDPFLIDGMREAVDRIRKAIAQKERILIFGDYDVDGILSVVSLSVFRGKS
jgi:single-stranded-DNA-specific exonuclease